jgi:hypothetical protein
MPDGPAANATSVAASTSVRGTPVRGPLKRNCLLSCARRVSISIVFARWRLRHERAGRVATRGAVWSAVLVAEYPSGHAEPGVSHWRERPFRPFRSRRLRSLTESSASARMTRNCAHSTLERTGDPDSTAAAIEQRALHHHPLRLRHLQPTRDFIARRTAEGLGKREILRCLKRYIAREVFAAIPRSHPAATALHAAGQT